MKRADWIGPLGGLVPIEGAGSIQVQRDSPVRVVSTVEGQRRVMRASTPTQRTWALSEDKMASDSVALIDAFVDGLYGRGPWVWVPGTAVVSSVLTPAQSALRNLGSEFAHAGPVVINGQSFPVSAAVDFSSSWRPLVDVPVVPGEPVTASVWVQAAAGTPIITTAFYVGADQVGTESTSGAAGGMWQRLTWTSTAPAGATQLRLGVRSSVTAVAAPQVTWTREPMAYAAGGAAAEAVVIPGKASAWSVWRDSLHSDVSYTVEEVGYAGW